MDPTPYKSSPSSMRGRRVSELDGRSAEGPLPPSPAPLPLLQKASTVFFRTLRPTPVSHHRPPELLVPEGQRAGRRAGRMAGRGEGQYPHCAVYLPRTPGRRSSPLTGRLLLAEESQPVKGEDRLPGVRGR